MLSLATRGVLSSPVNVTTVDSTAAGVRVVLDKPIYSWPAATYAAFPATKVTNVTSPGAQEILLVTEPWKPNIVSVQSLVGQIQVTLDQPLGTSVVPTSDSLPAVQLTGVSVIGSMLQLVHTGAVIQAQEGAMPTVGDLVTMPQPTVETSEATGIFQGAIIIRSAILKALRELRENPNLIRDALASLPQDDLTKGRYGEKTLDECLRWFTQVKVPVKLGLSLSQLTSPVISVELSGGDEAEATLGDVDYNVIQRDPWDASAARELGSVHAREQYNVVMMVQGEPEYLLFLDTLLRFGLLRHKEDLLDERGFTRLTWGIGPAGALPDVPGRENFFSRTLRLTGYCRHVWPVPLKTGQTAGFVESTEFGERAAAVAHNDTRDATSSPVTPTLPTRGGGPFDPENWADRDVLSGGRPGEILPPTVGTVTNSNGDPYTE